MKRPAPITARRTQHIHTLAAAHWNVLSVGRTPNESYVCSTTTAHYMYICLCVYHVFWVMRTPVFVYYRALERFCVCVSADSLNCEFTIWTPNSRLCRAAEKESGREQESNDIECSKSYICEKRSCSKLFSLRCSYRCFSHNSTFAEWALVSFFSHWFFTLESIAELPVLFTNRVKRRGSEWAKEREDAFLAIVRCCYSSLCVKVVAVHDRIWR